MRVLLIEDDQDTAELFKYLGEAEHVDTHICASGADALKYLETHEADAVILDLSLPVLDGLTIAQEIRRNEENHPDRKAARLAFYTGVNISETIERVSRRLGVDKIYQKPYEVSKIFEEVKSWFGE